MHTRAIYITCAMAIAAGVAGAPSAYAGGLPALVPNVPPTITSYFNPSSGIEYVFYVDTNDMLWSLTYNTHTHVGWTQSQLSQVLFSPGSPLLAYVDNYGQGRLFYFFQDQHTNNMDVLEYMLTSGGSLIAGSPFNLTSLLGFQNFPQAYALGAYGGTNRANFQTATGTSINSSTMFSTNIVGFQDSAATPTHHIFYLGNAPNQGGGAAYANTPSLYELYGSDAANQWSSHQIVSIGTTNGGTPTGLSAVWDGSVQHVYWNPIPGVIDEAYHSGNWYSHALNPTPYYAPYYNNVAVSVSGRQYIFGALWDSNYHGSSADGVYYAYEAPSWVNATISAPNLATNSGTVSYTWTDGTSGLLGGVDAGFFYVGSDDAIHETLPASNSTAILAYNAAQGHFTNGTTTGPISQFSPTTNQITGFYDGTTIHVFYIANGGCVIELYETASVITNANNGFGNWSIHSISSSCNAAN